MLTYKVRFEYSDHTMNTSSLNMPNYSNAVQNAQKQSSVVIKPKSKQDLSVTKTDMLKNINPINSNVAKTKVKNVRNGGLVLVAKTQRKWTNLKNRLTISLLRVTQ